MPHESHLAQDRSRSSVGKTSESSRDPPVEDTDSPQGQGSQHDRGLLVLVSPVRIMRIMMMGRMMIRNPWRILLR